MIACALLGAAAAIGFFRWGLPVIPRRASARVHRTAAGAQTAIATLAFLTGGALPAFGLSPVRGPAWIGLTELTITLALLYACVGHDWWRGRVPYRLTRPLVALACLSSVLWAEWWWEGLLSAALAAALWYVIWRVQPCLGDADVVVASASCALAGLHGLGSYILWLIVGCLLSALLSLAIRRSRKAKVVGGFIWVLATAALGAVFSGAHYPIHPSNLAFGSPTLSSMQWVQLAEILIATTALAIAAIHDARTHHLPDRVVLPALAACCGLMFVGHQWPVRGWLLLGVAGLPMLLHLLHRRFPGGDMKGMILLAAGYGSLFGLPYVAGTVIGLIHRRSLSVRVPMLPYVAAGLLVGLPVALVLSAGGITIP